MSIFKLSSFQEILIYLFVIVVTIYLMMCLMEISPDSYSKAFLDKEKSLSNQINQKKIVFIGGSSLAYGLHSDMVKQRFPNYQVFNMGLHAAIGLRTMIDQITPYISSGDIIVVSPEYEQFISMFYGNSSGTYLEVLVDQPRFFATMSIKSIPAVLEAIPLSLQNRAKFSLRKSFVRHQAPRIYNRRAFNSFGDVISHKSVTKSIVNLDSYRNTSYKNVEFKNKNDAIRHIVKLKRYAESKGASLYIAYPGFMESIWQRTKVEIINLSFEIQHSGIEALCTPAEVVQPDSMFLDTSYHLLYSGSKIRTETLLVKMAKKHII